MRVSRNTFLLVCECAWGQLLPCDRRAIRATCRGGRDLHDRSLKDMKILGGDNIIPLKSLKTRRQPPTPAELHTCITGVLQRGGKLTSLQLRFSNSDDNESAPSNGEYEEQLMAALYACDSYPLPALGLYGAIPHSRRLSVAVAAACPHLTSLTLRYSNPNTTDDGPCEPGVEQLSPEGGEAVRALLTLSGPRLRELTMTNGAHRWPAECFAALALCTALTKLELQAGSRDVDNVTKHDAYNQFLDSVDTEALVFSSIAQLTQLRSLDLRTNPAPGTCSPDALLRHIPALGSLSALTALTSLELVLPVCYMPIADNHTRLLDSGEQWQAWELVRQLQHGALLAAFRSMPHLQRLACPTLHLAPSDTCLTCLTNLTSLTLGGFLPPPPPALSPAQSLQDSGVAAIAAAVAAAAAAFRPGATPPAGSSLLPPMLQQLELVAGVSPGALAELQLPPSLTWLSVPRIQIGMSGLTGDGSMRPQTVNDLGAAVQLILSLPTPPELSTSSIELVAEGCLSLSGPRAHGPQGYAEWIPQLAGLDAFQLLTLSGGIRLQEGDLVCLASTLPELTELSLQHTDVPLAALRALTSIQQLSALQLDLVHLDQLTTEELADLLCTLCGELDDLSFICVEVDSRFLDADACKESVRAQLEEWEVGHVDVTITQHHVAGTADGPGPDSEVAEGCGDGNGGYDGTEGETSDSNGDSDSDVRLFDWFG